MTKREREAIEKLYTACSMSLPYLERCFQKSEPPGPDYFALPYVIEAVLTGLDAGRKFISLKELNEKPKNPRKV